MTPHRRSLALLIVGVVATFAVATSSVAGQARPRAFDPELLRTGDVIRYRDLERDDFLAEHPPVETEGMHDQLGAATCVFLATDPETSVRSSYDRRDLENGLVRAEVEDLGFLAFMDRECSWWNPAPLALPDAYILQHEQIHFALFEIAARRLNRRVDELTRQMQIVSTNQQSAFDEISRQIDVEIQRAMNEVLARSNEFDRETSRTFRQDRQNWWWQQVSAELEGLAPARFRP